MTLPENALIFADPPAKTAQDLGAVAGGLTALNSALQTPNRGMTIQANLTAALEHNPSPPALDDAPFTL